MSRLQDLAARANRLAEASQRAATEGEVEVQQLVREPVQTYVDAMVMPQLERITLPVDYVVRRATNERIPEPKEFAARYLSARVDLAAFLGELPTLYVSEATGGRPATHSIGIEAQRLADRLKPFYRQMGMAHDYANKLDDIAASVTRARIQTVVNESAEGGGGGTPVALRP